MEATVSKMRLNSITNSLWPLRIFMGATFLYAGLQHLTDPSYFDPSKSGYIGHLIAQYAVGSPIHDFLLGVVEPNAVLFGYGVAVGEALIGIATLLGFLFRITASAGLLLNFTFFLSATWNAFPFYFGSDIVFVMCWLTILLTGPQLKQSVDAVLARRYRFLSWLVSQPQTNPRMDVVTPAITPVQTQTSQVQVEVPDGAKLYPAQVREVNRAFERIKQQFVLHRETQTILEFVRAFVISLGVDRNDASQILSGLQNIINRHSTKRAYTKQGP
ncbi:MAG: TQO small subunit DoxD [Candidatus Bathyarchaeia archaeon]|jgi:thiosulfate dehydrogenase [quinone] large subunit